MSDDEIILWDCDRDCTSEGMRYKLARCWFGSRLLEVVTLSTDRREDDHPGTFVKNSKGETYTFYNRDFAIEKLNEWFPPEKIDPEFLLDDDDDSCDDDLIIDAD